MTVPVLGGEALLAGGILRAGLVIGSHCLRKSAAGGSRGRKSTTVKELLAGSIPPASRVMLSPHSFR
jgi:hypothetical protein